MGIVGRWSPVFGHNVYYQLVDSVDHNSACDHALFICQLQEARHQLGLLRAGVSLYAGVTKLAQDGSGR